MLLNWANAEQIPVIDMRRAFSLHPAAEIFSDRLHLRPLGDQLVAKESKAPFLFRNGRYAASPLSSSEIDGAVILGA